MKPTEQIETERVRSTLAGESNPVKLPRRLPIQRDRPAQSNIPNERAERDRLRSAAALLIKDLGLVPPISMRELREHSVTVCEAAGLDKVRFD